MRVNSSDFSRAAVFDCPPLRSSRVTGVYAHRYLLVLANGEPADPAAFVTANPQWNLGDRFTASDGGRWEDVPLAVEFRRRSGDVILSRGYPVSRPFPES